MARNVARGSLLGMLGQGWHLVTAFLLYAFLARRLGPTVFGEWSVTLSLLAWFELFVTSAIAKVVTKEISESPDDAATIQHAAYFGQTAVAAVVVGVVLAIADPLAAALGTPGLAPLIRLSTLDVPLYGLLTIASSVVLGRQRYERQGVAWLVYASAKAGLIAVLVWLGFSVQGALVGNALSSLVGFAALFLPAGGGIAKPAALSRVARGLLAASWPFLAIALIEGVGQHADLWLVSGIVSSGVPVGLYASATVLASVPVFLFLGLNRVIFPSVVEARAAGDVARADAYTTQAFRTALVVSVLAVALVAATGRQIIEVVYSPTYSEAFVPFVLLMVAGTGRTLQAVCTEVLMAQGRRGAALGILAGTVAAEVVAVAVLTELFALEGAAAGAALAALLAAALAALALRGSLGLAPLATFARCVLAGGVVGAVLAFADPPAAWIVLALPLAVAVYAGLLAALGEFGPEDRAAMRAAIGRRA